VAGDAGVHETTEAPVRRPGARGRPHHARSAGLLLTCLVAACTPTPQQPEPEHRAGPVASGLAVPTTTLARRRPSRPRGDDSWRLSHPAVQGEIEGYATTSSGLAGAGVVLRISTGARSFRVLAYRLGGYRGGSGRRVWGSRWLTGHRQPGPVFSDPGRRTVVARWRDSLVADTTGWTPGVYVFQLTTRSGRQALVPYVVSSPSVRGRVVVVVPVTTWQAYNDWGGYSLYDAPPGERRSWTVSFDRPYPPPGDGELEYGVAPVVTVAERTGVPLAYLTNLDVHRRRDALTGARAYVSAGHDEYWTPAMRQRVEQARDLGTNLLFLGANTMYWRIRVAAVGGRPGRLVTGYRSDAARDPAGPGRRTGLWRSPPRARPENELTGMGYECFPVDAPLRIVSPRWWGFAGTGVHPGQSFDHLVGVEADRVYPGPGTPRPLQVLASSSYSCRGVPTSAQAVYFTTRSGAGVLNVGTLRWTCALERRCGAGLTRRTVRFVDAVTRTVLRDFARGPAGTRHPARDNVARFHLPLDNQVPAS
jgi:hypothetical protein